MRRSVIWSWITVLGLGTLAAQAGDNVGGPTCCALCGQQAACVQRVCQVVCDQKKETKTGWTVECKEFCTLMPGCPDCLCFLHCLKGCPVPPRCGTPHCAKKLVKSEYQVTVPVYKGVVKYVCQTCAAGQESPTAVANAPLPPEDLEADLARPEAVLASPLDSRTAFPAR